VQLVDIILDKRISCTFIDDTNVENVIFCRPLEESLNNISLITTKDNEFIHNYLEESTGNYLVTNVFLDDGTVYEDVRFRLVTIEEGRELPASTINLSTLGLPSATDVLPPSRLIEEEYNLTLENAEENDDFSVIYNVPEVVDNTEIVQKIKSLESKLVTEQQKLEQEKIKLNRERITLENERRLSKALEDYKAELLQETFLVSNHQKELLEKSIQDLSKSFQEQFDSQQINVEKYLDTLSLANLEEVKKYQDIQVGKIKDQINNLLSERQDENALTTDKLLLERTSELESIFTEKLITELEDHKRNVKTEIDGINNALDNLIGEKLQENNDKVDRLLVNRAGVLQDQFNEKLTKDLTDHKNSLFNEFKTVSTETSSLLFTEKTEELNNALTIVLDEHKKNLNTTVTSKINEIGSTVNNFKTEIDGKLPQLDETIKEINKRIQTLVIEKKNVQVLADDARKYTDTKVAQASEEMMNYARRILDLGGGGGSVAVQFANGGTMNGNLNVTGQYLSGGVDISTLFGQGGNNPYQSGNVTGSILPINGNNNPHGGGYYTTVAGGSGNGGDSPFSFIGGGQNNSLYSMFTGIGSFIGSGTNNCALSPYTFIGTGSGNTVSGNYSAVVGGYNNNTNGLSAAFILGTNITAVSADTTYVNNLSTTDSIYTESIIGSGSSEIIIGDGTSDVSMGNNTLNLNFANGVFINGRSISTITGTTSPYVTGSAIGSIKPLSGSNTASGDYSNIAGGARNTASDIASTVAGGDLNTASGPRSNVAGGRGNTASGYSSNVAGGRGNTASGYSSNVAGGCSNQAQNDFTVVGGGKSNIASGYASYTGSGAYNCSQSAGSVTVGGYYNTTSATYASIVGGCYNKLTGSMSFIGGGCGNCDNGHNNVFILGCGIIAPQSNTTYTNNLSTGGTVYAKEVDAGTLSSAYLLGGGSEVVISDGSSDTGNGNSTLSLNFLSGVYVSSSLTVGASGSANITINQSPTTFINPVTASGQFLIVNINGSNKALQLWDYSS
jgi:hypothetical protein